MEDLRLAPGSRELFQKTPLPELVHPEVIERDIDRATRTGSFVVAQFLSEELTKRREHEGVTMHLTRAYLKKYALPLHEHLWGLQHPTRIPQRLGLEISAIYPEASGLIDRLSEERKGALPTYSAYRRRVYRDMTGSISELSVFALFARNQERHGFIAIPSDHDDDEYAPIDATGKRHAFDFIVAHESSPDDIVNLQVKTSDEFIGYHYAHAITVVSAEHIAGSYTNGKHSLPEAIVREGNGTATESDTAFLDDASDRLFKKIQKN